VQAQRSMAKQIDNRNCGEPLSAVFLYRHL
jgi:hypothetical protein